MAAETGLSEERAIRGRWASSVDDLVSYRYLGCQSEATDTDHAVGRMQLRSDMRWSGGLLGSPLAIAMLDTAGINIDGIRFGALTHVAIRIHESAADVSRIRVDGEVARLAKRAMFTECQMVDFDDPSRVIANGSADWISLGDVAPGFEYLDPGPGILDEPPMPPLSEAYFAETFEEGGYVIRELRSEVGAELLHHGPAMVALEWQAKDSAEQTAPGEVLSLRTFDVRFLRGGTRPSFATRSRGTGRAGNIVWIQAELVDDKGLGDVISRIEITYQVTT